MFGYAVDETPELMPLPITLAHKLARQLARCARQKCLDYLRPDGKTQVTVEYEDGRPVRVETIVVSTQHRPDVTPEQLYGDIIKHVIEPSCPGACSKGPNISLTRRGDSSSADPKGTRG